MASVGASAAPYFQLQWGRRTTKLTVPDQTSAVNFWN
jgi:hypothetical protein